MMKWAKIRRKVNFLSQAQADMRVRMPMRTHLDLYFCIFWCKINV